MYSFSKLFCKPTSCQASRQLSLLPSGLGLFFLHCQTETGFDCPINSCPATNGVPKATPIPISGKMFELELACCSIGVVSLPLSQFTSSKLLLLMAFTSVISNFPLIIPRILYIKTLVSKNCLFVTKC